ncbi:MAG: hypothetical protein GY906_23750 [bacterium]|nr:hypothetical protein [bacterium]
MVSKSVFDARYIEKLDNSIEWSDQQLTAPRRNRIEGIRQFVGYHHVDAGSPKRVPVPYIKLAVNIYSRMLAPRSPRAMITTQEDPFKPTAAAFELAVNEIPEEISLQETMLRLVMESLFSVGCLKVGLYKVGNQLGHEYGRIFADVITIDDLVIDMSAKHPDDVQFVGNNYWLDYEEVMESKYFKNKDGLKADDYTLRTPSFNEESATDVTVDSTLEPLKKKVWLRDVWVPSEGRFVTYGIKSKRKFKEIEWTGPETGPYHFLGYDLVPGSVLPLPPLSSWRDLHDLSNSLWRKLGNQADSQKTVQGFGGGDDEGAENFKGASDGDGIHYKGGEPKKLTAGGVDQRTLAFSLVCKDLFSYFGGNLDSMGGLGAQTETLGQDRLLSEASSAQIKQMADSVVAFSQKLFRTFAWYEWNDPVLHRTLKKRIPGTDISLEVPWGREQKKGEFENFRLKIDIYSLHDDSPSSKLMRLRTFLNEFVIPLMPIIESQGGSIDAKKIIELAAKYTGFPEGDEIVIFMDSVLAGQAAGQGSGVQAPGSPNGGVYEHVTKGAGASSTADKILQNALSGGGNGSEGPGQGG